MAPRTARTVYQAVGDREDGPIFVHDGRRMERHHAARIIRRLARQAAAGIEGTVNPRDLRTTCTTLLSDKMSAERLADLLGHKDTRMVFAHYRQRGGEAVKTAAEYWG